MQINQSYTVKYIPQFSALYSLMDPAGGLLLEMFEK